MPYPMKGGGISRSEVESMVAGAASAPRSVNNMVIGDDRDRDITYTNTSDREMYLYLSSTGSTSTNQLVIVVDAGLATEIKFFSGSIVSGVSTRVAVSAVVPPGSTYLAQNRDIISWIEVI